MVAAYAAVLDDVGMDLAIVERMYIRALQLEPTYVLALHGLGTVMHRMERFAEAEMYYKLALGIEPTHEGAFEEQRHAGERGRGRPSGRSAAGRNSRGCV